LVTDEILSFKLHRWQPFPNETYRSISVFEFALGEPGAGTSMILRSLLDNDQYPESFIARYPSPTVEIDGAPVRGPFFVDRLTTDSFDRVTAESVWDAIDSFLLGGDPPATRQDLRLEALFWNAIDNASEIFRLGENQGARHDIEGLSWILLEFAEFVAINRRGGVVVDVVLSMD
jgi:hypothetical protein